MSSHTQICDQLAQMGFTSLEAEIYLALLTKGKQTGYAIAKHLKKPTANVYKAIDSLTNKGAVEFTTDNKKSFFACDWKVLLERKQQQFNETLSNLEQNLSQLDNTIEDDEQVYQIAQVDLVIEHSNALINNAQHLLMVEAEPDSLPLFKEALIAAAARGVEVWIKAYEEITLENVNVVVRQNGHEIYQSTNDVSFKLAADGNAMLIANLTAQCQGVIQAFRSNSALMAMSIYSALLYEIILTELKQTIPNGNIQAAQALLEKSAHLHPISTKNAVFQQYKDKYQDKRDLK
ncbi:MAG: TrmB family transcriptional regulator [Psychrobium sp.]